MNDAGVTAEDLLDFDTAIVGAATAGTDGTDGTTVLAAGGGAVIKSHAIVAGKVTFDDADNYAGALVLAAGDLAAAVEYLASNDLGNAGSTVAFTIGANSFVYNQTDTTAGSVGGYSIVQLTGVAVAGVELADANAGYVLIG